MQGKRTVIARMKEHQLPTLPQALGLMDPEIVVWEKIPFSFVWDWFQPIGPYLEARAFAQRLTGTFVTSEKKTGIAFPVQLKGTKEFYSGPSYPDYMGNRDVIFSRTISTTLKVPKPEFKGLASASSFQHCLNGLALLTSFATGYSKVR